MRLLFGNIIAAAIALFLFSFLQANAECGNMTGDCDNEGNMKSDSNYKNPDDYDDDNDNNDGVYEDDGYIDDGQDYTGSQDDNKKHDECIFPECYYPIPGNSDKGEDDKCKWPDCYYPLPDNNDNKNNNNKDSNSGSNSNDDANSNVKKFNVKVILNGAANAEAQKFQMRVFVYGQHTLNKPTLDKPGKIVDISSCSSSCYTEWDFTASKVPIGSEIKACVWNQKSGHQNCGSGKASSNYGPETIHIRLPSSTSKTGINQEPFLNNNSPTTVTSEQNLTKFLWGAATSPYQVEGGITDNDWNYFTTSPKIQDRIYKLTSNNFFYHGNPIMLQPAGDAVKEWNLDYFEKDLDRAKQIGMNALRIGIEWARIEPQNNQWNSDAIQHYKQMITIMREKGIAPIITLNHFTLPIWVLRPPTQFTKTIGQNFLPSPLKELPLSEPPATDGYWMSLRGWENPVTVREFDEFVKKIVPEFKDQVDYWITLNEPVGPYIGLGYLAGLWPPGFFLDGNRAEKVLHNLIQAHVDAYDIISSIDNVDADKDGITKSVGFSHAMTYVKPATNTLVDNTEAAKNFDYFTNDYFLNAVVNGEEDFNYLRTVQRHNTDSRDFIFHSNWKNKIDFVGINYYRASYVKFDAILALSSARFVGGVPLNDLRLEAQPHGKLNDMGWEIYPEGLYKLIIRIANQWNIPVLISENGIPDKYGTNRGPYIESHILQMNKAIDDGANVIGYVYWSLMDNYEWQDAYSPDSRFGLYQVNRNSPSFERVPTQAVDTLRHIINQTDFARPTSEPPAETPLSASQFSAKLNGGNEVPPTDSEASGTASFSVKDELLSYKIQVSKLNDVAGAFLQSAKEGSNGDVVALLARDYPAEGEIASTDLVGPLKGKSVSDLVDLMKKGRIYVNLHSSTFPDGEIRGQVR